MSSIEVLESSPVNRDQLIGLLKADKIDTRPVFPAISQYPIWDDDSLNPKPIALHIGDNCINLPSGAILSESKIKYISARINIHTGN